MTVSSDVLDPSDRLKQPVPPTASDTRPPGASPPPDTSLPPGASAPHRSANADYHDLRQQVQQRGLMAPQPGYMAFKIVSTLALLGLGLAWLAMAPNLGLRLLAAAFLAIVFTQIGLVAHDIGHRQTLRSARAAEWLGMIHGNLLLGISRHWWVDKHNRHHSHPNEEDNDPDLDIPFIAFSEEAARERRGLPRLIVRHQAALLFPMMLFQALALRHETARFLLAGRVRHLPVEVLFTIAHVVLYVGFVVLVVPGWEALAVIAVHQALFGLYMASIFAPNHKGMPLWESAGPPDFLRQQVITSRNVRSGIVNDFWYGGLNYQIEHHLFPTMPRNKLREAQAMVKHFCQQRGIPYHETGVLQSYREILAHLSEVSAVLRTRPGA
jgi:fatty acid desaturase